MAERIDVEEIEELVLALSLRDLAFFQDWKHILKPSYFFEENGHSFFYESQSEFVKEHGTLITQTSLKVKIKGLLQATKKQELFELKYKNWEAEVERIWNLPIENEKGWIEKTLPQHIKEIEIRSEITKAYATGDVYSLSKSDKLKKAMDFEIDMKEKTEEEVQNKLISSFPKEAFQGWVYKVASVYSEVLESPFPFWIFNAAACLGNFMSGKVSLETSLFPHPNLYVICLGPSGVTRKSESAKQVFKLFKRWELFYRKAIESDEFTKFRPIFGVGSAEGLLDVLGVHPKCLLFFDELRSFVQKCSISSSNLLQIINTLFENHYYENIVKKKSQSVENVMLSMIGCCTIETWNSMFTDQFTSMGFINRLWLVPGEGHRKYFLPPEVPETKMLSLCTGLSHIYNAYPEPKKIYFPRSAQDILQDWYINSDNDECTVRLDTYGQRLLLLMSLSERTDINDDMVKRVVQLLEWQKEVRKAFQPQEYTSVMARLEGLLRKTISIHPRVTKGQLFNKIHADRFEIWKVNKALQNLVENAEVKELPSRKTTLYERIIKPR